MLNVIEGVNFCMPILNTITYWCMQSIVVVFSCTVVSCPTFQTGTSQGQAKCSIITNQTYLCRGNEWVWCMRLGKAAANSLGITL